MGEVTKLHEVLAIWADWVCSGPKQYADFPIDNKHAFAMITELFSPRSKGTVVLKSKEPLDNPIVDHNYLSDPLDLLVLTEGVRMGNEVVMQGKGTKDIVKGSWPGKYSFLYLSFSIHFWETS